MIGYIVIVSTYNINSAMDNIEVDIIFVVFSCI